MRLGGHVFIKKGNELEINNKFITKDKKDVSQWNQSLLAKVTLASD
jgi:hypothetical protein